MVPVALFDLVIEYQVAVLQLTRTRVYGPAFALIRAQFEAFVRGVWLRYAATPLGLKKFVVSDRIFKLTGTLISEIESRENLLKNVFSGLHANSWKSMCSYTHGGMLQVTRRFRNNSIEPNYELLEIFEVVKSSGFLALLALNQIAQIADAEEVTANVGTLLDGSLKELPL